MKAAPEQPEFVVRGRQVLTPRGWHPASIHVEHGRIARIAALDDVPSGAEVVDADPCVVLPGLVDTHVHVNEPGRTDWEGFWTATRAAAAGGVTTLMDMPLNSIPPTTTRAALEEKQRAAEPQCHVDVGLWGGVVPGNTGELAPMHAAGVPGFKCFLLPSGVDEFPSVDEKHLREALPLLKQLGAVLLVHAELGEPIDQATAQLDCEPRHYGCYLTSRPAEAERQAVELLVRLCREFGTPIHIVHLACAEAMELIRKAQQQGLPMTAETCPHYLTLDSERVPDGATPYKCAPPVREREHAEALWRGLNQQVLDMVVTDHSPCTPELKLPDSGDFLHAWGGISSLQLGLAATWTAAAERGIPLERVARWMTTGPAKLAGLADRKGSLQAGYDADLILFDPDAEWAVHGASLEHRHGLTPYEGHGLRGLVRTTFVRGQRVHENGTFDETPRGRLLEGKRS